MSTLPSAPTICFYNGVTWPTETETVAVAIKPVSDSSGRAVKYVLYQLTLKAVFGQANQGLGMTTDSDLAALRRRLTAYAGELHYEAVGMGNLTVNVPAAGPTVGAAGTARDAIWGPKPTLMVFKPLGQYSADVTWSVEVAIPECDLATYAFATMEWCWTVTWDIDASGLTTRTHSGFVRIPQTRASVDARTLTDQADRLRESIVPGLLPGFRRIPGTFELSEDKCRLDWSVTDEEWPSPNYPPPGAVDAQASHTLTTSQFYAALWKGTLSASYEISRDRPRSSAEGMFAALVADRVTRARGLPFQGPGNRPLRSVVIFKGYEESEPEIYGKRCAAFRCEYTLTTTLPFLAQISGLWRPLAGNDATRWAQSLLNTAFHCRGVSKQRFSATDDAIIDLCEPAVYPPPTIAAGPRPPDRKLQTGQPKNDPPDPATSWLAYYCVLTIEQLDETIELKTLPTTPPRPPSVGPGITPSRPPASTGDYALHTGGTEDQGVLSRVGTRGDQTAPLSSASPGASLPGSHIVQVRAEPSYYAYLTGFAIRAGHPINPPTLVSVGGAKAFPANREGDGFSQGVLAVWFGLAIHSCRWRTRWLLAGKPAGDIPVMGNPFL